MPHEDHDTDIAARPELPQLLIFARCPRCQTWVFTGDHSDEECQRWRALRSDPSHEHRWHLIAANAASCLDCRALGEIRYPEGDR